VAEFGRRAWLRTMCLQRRAGSIPAVPTISVDLADSKTLPSLCSQIRVFSTKEMLIKRDQVKNTRDAALNPKKNI
jgi:hypothetical protein